MEVFELKISLNLLLEELGFELDRPHSINPSFSRVEQYLLGRSDFSGESLLISTLSEALLVPAKPGLYFLCVRDRMVDDLETDEALERIFIVRRNMDSRDLFTVVQRLFMRIHDWVMQMQVSVLNNRGMQDLMDISEPVLGNHITVLDSSFKLLAYTKNVKTDDENLVQLMELGYHSEETVKKFHLHRRIEQFETADESDIIINDDYAISSFVTAKRVYKAQGAVHDSHYASVVMVCCYRPCTDASIELFCMVLDNIKYYIDRERPIITGNTPVEKLFCELISKTLTNETEALKRASYLRVPYEGFFVLSILVFDDIINTPTGRFVRELSLTLPGAKVILYGSDILIINMYGNQDITESSGIHMESLKKILGYHNVCCGVSNQFNFLHELSAAYDQARTAAVVGERLRKQRGDENGVSFYVFEDMFLYHFVNHCIDTKPELFLNSFTFRAVRMLAAHDEKHGSKLVKLLEVYLGSERNATSTCNAMHMHRNTVVYNIEKIESLLGVKLDDEDVRVKLVLGLKANTIGQLKDKGCL